MRESDTPRLKIFFKVIVVQLQWKVIIWKKVGRVSHKRQTNLLQGQSWKTLGTFPRGVAEQRKEQGTGGRRSWAGSQALLHPRSMSPDSLLNFLQFSLLSCENGCTMPACAVTGQGTVPAWRQVCSRCSVGGDDYIRRCCSFSVFIFS